MPLIATHELKPNSLPQQHIRQVYCGLDSMLTVEVLGAMQKLGPTPLAYDFERALQGPILEMMLRGERIDDYERQKAIQLLQERLIKCRSILDRFANAAWGKGLNAASPQQKKAFFYDFMKLPEQTISVKGVKRISTNRESLEKLDLYLHARPFVNVILAIQDYSKQLQQLQQEVDPDGRMRTQFNIAGTESWRLSSSKSVTGSGGNMQNTQKDDDDVAQGNRVSIKKMFISDSGWKLCGIDLEQTESHDVGWLHGILLGDWRYLDGVEAGDIHTTVAKMVWPKLGWTNDRKYNRQLADRNFYRNFSYRDMSKRGGHACLTEDHEVLTPKGWVPITSKPPIIMTWDGQNTTVFSHVSNWTDMEYSGDLHEFDGTSVSAKMTSEHRVPYITRPGNPLREKKACEGPGSKMPLGWGWQGGTYDVPARLIAAFMSDGHQKSANRMEFHFHKERKKTRLRELCERYGYSYDETDDKIFVHGSLPKRAGAFMFHWTKNSLLEFIDEYKYWDGHQAPTSVSLHSVEVEQLEWLQTFGRILGIGGNIQKPQVSGFGSICYSLQQNNRTYADGSSMKHTKSKAENVRVLCPTVPTSWFYVRRNGRIHITGNSNYMTTPWTISRSLKIPMDVAKHFQAAYYEAFPGFQKWFRHTAQELQTKQHLTTPFGMTRWFFARPDDDATLREAIAFVPQNMTACRMNLAMWRLWRYGQGRVQMLKQVHDAVYFQYRQTDEKATIEWALEQIKVPITNGSRTMVVRGEAKIGWNEGNYHPEVNPDGLRKWSSSSPDERERRNGRNRPI